MTVAYLDLDPVQREVLETLPFEGNHLVEGPPGSGKSLLAVQRAVMIALTGRPVVLLTRSNLLRQSLAPMATALGARQAGVEVATVHSWLHRTYGKNVPRTEDGWFDWPLCYQRAAQAQREELPAMVVDEGQDLPVGFYRLCRILATPTSVFADECQRLTESQSTLEEIVSGLGRCSRASLKGNHRNTRQVAELAARFHTGTAAPELPEREGPVPRLHRLPNTPVVAEVVHFLAKERPRHCLGVVVASRRSQFGLLHSLERIAPRLRTQMYTSQAAGGRYRTVDLTRPGVVIVHRASAKGLGFDTVLIPDTHVDAATDPTSAALRMSYYVMATRAREELHLGYAGDAEPALLGDIPRRVLVRS